MTSPILRRLAAACVVTLAGLSTPAPAPAQMMAPPVSSPYYYPNSAYPRGGYAPQYYAAPRPYSSYSYGYSRRTGGRFFGRNRAYYWPTGRDVPMAKPWLTR